VYVDENNILLMLDEIITGFGRTGRMFCFEHYGIVPDIFVCAKGVASGFPISLVVSTDEIMNTWGDFQHTSTFSANPIGCAEKRKLVGDVRGLGMMCGIELIRDTKKTPAVEESKKVVEYALRHGVILQPPGGRFVNVVKMSPPLVMTHSHLRRSIE